MISEPTAPFDDYIEYLPVLLTLMNELDTSTPTHVREAFEQKYKRYIPAKDRATMGTGKERWAYFLERARFDLTDFGLMQKPAVGIWSISNSGRTWLKQHSDTESAIRSILTMMDERKQAQTKGIKVENRFEFRWHGNNYLADADYLATTASQLILNENPPEAFRFTDWVATIHGKPVSVEWLFHLLTKADYSEFVTYEAVAILRKLGVPVSLMEKTNLENSKPEINLKNILVVGKTVLDSNAIQTLLLEKDLLPDQAIITTEKKSLKIVFSNLPDSNYTVRFIGDSSEVGFYLQSFKLRGNRQFYENLKPLAAQWSQTLNQEIKVELWGLRFVRLYIPISVSTFFEKNNNAQNAQFTNLYTQSIRQIGLDHPDWNNDKIALEAFAGLISRFIKITYPELVVQIPKWKQQESAKIQQPEPGKTHQPGPIEKNIAAPTDDTQKEHLQTPDQLVIPLVPKTKMEINFPLTSYTDYLVPFLVLMSEFGQAPFTKVKQDFRDRYEGLIHAGNKNFSDYYLDLARSNLYNLGLIDNLGRGVWAISEDARIWLNYHTEYADALKEMTVMTKDLGKGRIGIQPSFEFRWHGITYNADVRKLTAKAIPLLRLGNSPERFRLSKWYAKIEGELVSVKWLFHLLTNARYDEFASCEAVTILRRMGIRTGTVDKKDTSKLPSGLDSGAIIGTSEVPLAKNKSLGVVVEVPVLLDSNVLQTVPAEPEPEKPKSQATTPAFIVSMSYPVNLLNLMESLETAPASEVKDAFEKRFRNSISREDQRRRSNGKYAWTYNLDWAFVELSKSGLMVSPKTGTWAITKAGLSWLKLHRTYEIAMRDMETLFREKSRVKIVQSESKPPIQFRWHDKNYYTDGNALIAAATQLLRLEHSPKAFIFVDWVARIDGKQVSVEWLFHLLTNTKYTEFTTAEAVPILRHLGIQIAPVTKKNDQQLQPDTAGEKGKQETLQEKAFPAIGLTMDFAEIRTLLPLKNSLLARSAITYTKDSLDITFSNLPDSHYTFRFFREQPRLGFHLQPLKQSIIREHIDKLKPFSASWSKKFGQEVKVEYFGTGWAQIYVSNGSSSLFAEKNYKKMSQSLDAFTNSIGELGLVNPLWAFEKIITEAFATLIIRFIDVTYSDLVKHFSSVKKPEPVELEQSKITQKVAIAPLVDLNINQKQIPAQTHFIFRWQNKTFQADPQSLTATASQLLRLGNPPEAFRFVDWYTVIDGKRVSVKWLFHLLTSTKYSEFLTSDAVPILRKMGFTLFNKKHTGYQLSDQVTTGERINSKSQVEKAAPVSKVSADFAGIQAHLPKDNTLLAQAKITPEKNALEIVFPELPASHYAFRLTRETAEVGFYLQSLIPRVNHERIERLKPLAAQWSQAVGQEVIAEHWGKNLARVYITTDRASSLAQGNYHEMAISKNVFTQQIGQFGKDHYLRSHDKIITEAFAALLMRFIEATYPDLVTQIYRQRQPSPSNKAAAAHIENPQSHLLLTQKIAEIRGFLAGRLLRAPRDEELCDWIQLCYILDLPREGQQLFTFVQSQTLNNDWLYRRTKKYADLCRLKAAKIV